ncbi:hypothetical protein [Cellulomonas sp. WB94]|uniref:hypothetical protein n=1 Tax=Cellulomonas sp. WB94 TaxID=2173174 RepID=UPI0011B25E46|nr:hypothetical protein [Cellulomonas sp. WB94]
MEVSGTFTFHATGRVLESRARIDQAVDTVSVIAARTDQAAALVDVTGTLDASTFHAAAFDCATCARADQADVLLEVTEMADDRMFQAAAFDCCTRERRDQAEAFVCCTTVRTDHAADAVAVSGVRTVHATSFVCVTAARTDQDDAAVSVIRERVDHAEATVDVTGVVPDAAGRNATWYAHPARAVLEMVNADAVPVAPATACVPL